MAWKNAALWTALVCQIGLLAGRSSADVWPKPGDDTKQAAPFTGNQSIPIPENQGFSRSLAKRQCPRGSGLCSFSGRCCYAPYDACCEDGTCIVWADDFCCGGGGQCPRGQTCCNGCAPSGSTCCSSEGRYCESGRECCEGRCIPDGTECCRGGNYCPSGEYCRLLDGDLVCCTTSDCGYYEWVTWVYYYYWYVYLYIRVDIEVTTTTLSRTSTQRTTSTRATVYATDDSAASSSFSSISRSLSSETPDNIGPTPTSGTFLVDGSSTVPFTPGATSTTRATPTPDSDGGGSGNGSGSGGGDGASTASKLSFSGWNSWMAAAIAASCPALLALVL